MKAASTCLDPHLDEKGDLEFISRPSGFKYENPLGIDIGLNFHGFGERNTKEVPDNLEEISHANYC